MSRPTVQYSSRFPSLALCAMTRDVLPLTWNIRDSTASSVCCCCAFFSCALAPIGRRSVLLPFITTTTPTSTTTHCHHHCCCRCYSYCRVRSNGRLQRPAWMIRFAIYQFKSQFKSKTERVYIADSQSQIIPKDEEQSVDQTLPHDDGLDTLSIGHTLYSTKPR